MDQRAETIKFLEENIGETFYDVGLGNDFLKSPKFKTSVHQSSGPQPFWHQGPVSWKTIFPRTGKGGRWRNGSGGNASDGERQMKLHSLASLSPPAVQPKS